MIRISSAHEGRNYFSEFLKRFSSNVLHLGQVMTIELLQQAFEEAAIAIHAHVGKGAGR